MFLLPVMPRRDDEMSVIFHTLPDGTEHRRQCISAAVGIVRVYRRLYLHISRKEHLAGFVIVLLGFCRCPPVLKVVQHSQHILRQSPAALVLHLLRYSVECLGYASRDAGERIAVSSQRHRRPYHILKVLSLQKSGDCLRYRLLTRLHVVICRSDLIAAPGQIISELVRDISPDLVLVRSRSCHIDSRGGRLGTLYPLRVVMRHLGRQSRVPPRLTYALVQPARGRYAHGGAVAVAAVRLRMPLS